MAVLVAIPLLLRQRQLGQPSFFALVQLRLLTPLVPLGLLLLPVLLVLLVAEVALVEPLRIRLVLA